MAIDSVFKFLVEREQKFLAGEDPNDSEYDRMDSEEDSDDDGKSTYAKDNLKDVDEATSDKQAEAKKEEKVEKDAKEKK